MPSPITTPDVGIIDNEDQTFCFVLDTLNENTGLTNELKETVNEVVEFIDNLPQGSEDQLAGFDANGNLIAIDNEFADAAYTDAMLEAQSQLIDELLARVEALEALNP